MIPMRRTNRLAVLLCAAVCILLAGSTASAEDDAAPLPKRLVVGTKEAPPFAMKGEDGVWHGISVELWRGIGEDFGFETEWQERDLDGLLDGVRDGSLDAAVAAITVTSDRETSVDFSHAFYTSGLGIAVRPEGDSGWSAILGRVLSSDFLKAVLALAGILAAAGFLLWVFERRKNQEQFGGSTAKGIGNAFWWSAVTMTTVGYGDKAPVTTGGRLVALVWMFASIILIAGFTASIASALTVSELESSIHGPEDLPGLTVGTVPESTSDAYLKREGIRVARFASVREALVALADGSVEAVVYDHPLLVWLAGRDPALAGRVSVLPRTFDRQDYAIALPPGSPVRETLNRALLKHITAPEFDEVVRSHLGAGAP